MAHRALSSRTITMSQPTDLLQLYRAESSRFPRVGEAEERRLAGRIQSGDEDALMCLINANLRMVLTLVQGFRNRAVDVMDLISEGNLGLMKAARKYDGRVRFWCYSQPHVIGMLKRAMANGQFSMRLPQGAYFEGLAMKKSADRFEERTGREPSVDDLAAESGLAAHKVENYLGIFSGAYRLDAKWGRDDEGEDKQSLAEHLSDGKFEAEQDSGLDRDRAEIVYQVLEGMEPRARAILEARHGVVSGEPMTCAALAERMGVSRERIRQMEQRAEVRIRASL